MLRQVQELRGIAVLAVVIFHLKPEVLPNGYLGVDIFFLISGFVITRKLHNSSSGSLKNQILNFCLSRARRIMPSVSVLIVVVSLLSFFLQDPIGTQQSTSKSGLASLFGFANLYFANTSLDYFGTPAQDNPLLHMWSLGVEYQFYLFFPLLMIPMKKLPAKTKLLVLSLVLIISLAGAAVSEQATGYSGLEFNFYNPNFRIWEFLAGAILYLSGLTLRVSLAGSWFLHLIVFAVLFFPRIEPGFVWIMTLAIIMISSISLISEGKKSNSSSYQFLARIGDRSFSLYLWHWPVVVFVRYFLDGVIFQVIAIFLIAISTMISFRYVESNRKLRFIDYGFPRPLIAWLMIPALACFSYGWLAAEVLYPKYVSGEYSSILKGQIGNIGRVEQIPNYVICNSLKQRTECTTSVNIAENRILLIGDSHAGVLAADLAKGVNLSDIANLDFFHTNGLTQTLEKSDLELIGQHIKANSYLSVIISANWDRLGQSENLGEFLRSASMKAHIILIEDNPVFPFNAFRCAYGLSHFLTSKRCETSRMFNSELFKEIQGVDNLSFINTKDLFCDDLVCSMKKGHKIQYFDSNHLNENGATLLSKLILKHMDTLALGHQPSASRPNRGGSL